MKQMLQAMNGQCGYTKNLPAGSVFWFQVPCSSWNMKAAALLDDEALPMIRSAPSVLKPLDSSILSPLVANSAARQCGSEGALLVDDDRLAYFVLARMLRRSGVDLQGRFDGAAGLSLLTSGCFSWCVFCLCVCSRLDYSLTHLGLYHLFVNVLCFESVAYLWI